MINNIFGFNYNFDFQFFRLMLLCVLLGLFSKFLIGILMSQNFAKNIHQLIVFALLPTVGFVITSVISDNIALSLGMVGALSIVRFRTPVKNPSELVVYFYLITLGIVVNVNPSTGISFAVFIALITFLVEIYKFFSKKADTKFFLQDHFSYYLRLELKNKYDDLKSNKGFQNLSFDKDIYLYNFAFYSVQELDKTIESVEESDIISYNIAENK